MDLDLYLHQPALAPLQGDPRDKGGGQQTAGGDAALQEDPALREGHRVPHQREGEHRPVPD